MKFIAKKCAFLSEIAAFAAFGLVLTLAACDDSSSSSGDEPPESSSVQESSSSVSEPGSSSVPDSSGAPEACENEGAIDSLMNGNAKYGYTYTYRKCEQGKWIERPEWVTCDTTGVKEGNLCRLRSSVSGFQFGSDVWTCYKYAGEGTWNKTDCPAGPDKKCDAENKDAKEELYIGNDTLYFQCTDAGWNEISLADYHCASKDDAVGDTCIFEKSGETLYFIYDSVDTNVGRWNLADFDPKLGYCTVNRTVYQWGLYIKKGDEYYYCSGTKWVGTNFLPIQCTDDRRVGKDDESYDMLDLPEEAKVGDRANGLMEKCYYDRTLDPSDSNVYDYCIPINHYRYREDGSWTMETFDDRHEDDIDPDTLPCGGSTWCCAETEGMERRIFQSYDEPERLYKCVSGEIKLVEYLWSRFEKK